MFSIRSLRLTTMSGALAACTQASTLSDNAGISPGVPGTVTVSGRVTSTDGTPLPEATISIPGANHDGRTDADGNYTITNVTPGQSTVVVSRSGYTTTRTEAKFSTKRGDSGRNHIDITLFTPEETEAFLTRGAADSAILARVGFLTRQVSVRDAYFVTPQDIASIRPRTIADIFKHVPVMMDNPMVSGTQLRGSPGCFVTYVNGIVRRGVYRKNLDTYVSVTHVVAAEVYPPRQFPPAPFNRGTSQAECATVGIWTRA